MVPDELTHDKMHEECGVFGVHAPGDDVANITYFGLYALQHRGQESAGIAVSDGTELRIVKEMGLVAQVFDQDALDGLKGDIAIGHTRYSTTGSTKLDNAQPMRFTHPTAGPFLVAHNGNLTNTRALHDELAAAGATFDSTSDTEVLGRLLERTPAPDLVEALRLALPRATGAYCLVLLTTTALIAARDPLGIRPLCLGQLGEGDEAATIVASETCALDVVGAEHLREVEPGEIVEITTGGMRSVTIESDGAPRATCSFEFIYFARPDSEMSGRSLYEARRAMGRRLAEESPAEADIVITMPDSGTPAAVGYAERSGMPFVEGMIKSRYITRTFIQPSQRLRESATRLKFNPMRHVLDGKRVVLVDDSIVRGTTSRHIVEELRHAGAAEVHMRIASPPIVWPCFMGIDMATRNELIAAENSDDEVGRLVGADSLRYLSLMGLRESVGAPDGAGFCFACFTGEYPVPLPEQSEGSKLALEIPLTPRS